MAQGAGTPWLVWSEQNDVLFLTIMELSMFLFSSIQMFVTEIWNKLLAICLSVE